jgi:hypothetical protein
MAKGSALRVVLLGVKKGLVTIGVTLGAEGSTGAGETLGVAEGVEANGVLVGVADFEAIGLPGCKAQEVIVETRMIPNTVLLLHCSRIFSLGEALFGVFVIYSLLAERGNLISSRFLPTGRISKQHIVAGNWQFTADRNVITAGCFLLDQYFAVGGN